MSWQTSNGAEDLLIQCRLAVYIPINPRAGERQLTINIVTNGNGNGARPNWRIAVHQFECPFGQTRSMNAIQPVSHANEILRAPRTIISDWLAPAGCLQYFAMPTGQIESFNFNNGKGTQSLTIFSNYCYLRVDLQAPTSET